MTEKGENEMASTFQPHVITSACPLSCIEWQVPGKAYQAVRRHLKGESVIHPTVRDVVELCQQGGLAGIRGLGAQGVEVTAAFLETAGLIPARPGRTGQPSAVELAEGLTA